MPPILEHAWASSPPRLVTALVLTLGFALAARLLRGVNKSGTLAGASACLLLFVGAGPAAFAALAILFAMTWLSTRIGYRRKHELGVAEHRGGRNGWQVSANLTVAVAGSLLYSLTGFHGWLVATIAALAEAATDTVASEIGQTYARDGILITTGESVPAGTDGGITRVGTSCGVAAGLVIVAVAILGGILPPAQFWIPASAGIIGMFVDSVLGATLQPRGWMNNEAVNLVGTMTAAVFAYLLSTI
jgi:uncharacterized protein (TIGR00297 family)